ncbi:glycosyltransferase family 4 protein [Marisediminicola sp. LYQ134]|uniref:glycosyltransferase family 4 protein n=1 Tax=Marisediminicola sp. LYQ134 TaxID=3391061 RepID=UPI003983D545
MSRGVQESNVIGIVQPFVPSYRRGFFDAVAAGLAQHDLTLEVWHAQPTGRVAARGNASSGPWSVAIDQHRLSLGRRNLTFRNIAHRARSARAVVAGLASTNLETYALALDPRVHLMLWGHGRNYTASNFKLDGAIESWLCRRSAHVFAYTDGGKEHLVARGTPGSDVTVVQNSTDTKRLLAALANLGPNAEAEVRQAHGLHGAFVGLFVGALDAPKQLPMLFEAADLIHASHPEFVLVIAGAGPDESSVRSMASAREYVRMIGSVDASALAQLSLAVDLVLMPGRIGLVAVDALALGLPIATTRYPFHAPEADYLTDGIDSIWTDFDPRSFADGVSGLIADTERRGRMSDAAAAKGRAFSVEQSASRFVDGVVAGLTR